MNIVYYKSILYILILLSGIETAVAVPYEEWNKTYGYELISGYSCDIGWSCYASTWSVQQTSDGGYILAGSLDEYYFSQFRHKAYVIKTDPSGDIQWHRTFGEIGTSAFFSIDQTLDGGYIISGYINSSGNMNTDIWLVKTDMDGNEQWNTTLVETGDGVLYSVQQTMDGGYVAAGENVWYVNGSYGLARLIKIDASGSKQWDKTFTGNSQDTKSVKQTSDGGYILVGYKFIKTDEYGNEQWRRMLDGNDVQQTKDGGFIIVGNRLIKTDQYGNEQWSRTFDGAFGYRASNGAFRSVWQTIDEGYILSGVISVRTLNGDSMRPGVAKTDINGNILWYKTFNNGNDIQSGQQTKDGGYILTINGHTSGPTFLVKLSSDSCGNTPNGSNIQINPMINVNMIFDSVTQCGNTVASASDNRWGPFPDNYNSIKIYNIGTTAIYTNSIVINISYLDSDIPPEINEPSIKLFHYENGNWIDITTFLDTNSNTITGIVASLSPFAIIGESTITPTVTSTVTPTTSPTETPTISPTTTVTMNTVKGSSFDYIGLIILSICLIIVSILMLRKR